MIIKLFFRKLKIIRSKKSHDLNMFNILLIYYERGRSMYMAMGSHAPTNNLFFLTNIFTRDNGHITPLIVRQFDFGPSMKNILAPIPDCT